MDKIELIKKIRKLDGLNNDEKSDLVGLLRTHKKYGLVWEDKPEDIEERLREELPILKEVKDKAIIGEDADAPNHILIEGDNLEALTALSYTHEGKIDVIYIDPPYNTGAKNWKYNNDYVDKEDAYKHSKFISFIYKRLSIAKHLLSEKGIIVCTIDDYEEHNVRHIMDLVFGEENRLCTFIIKNNPSGRSTLTGASISHEYALFYSKKNNSILGRLPRNEKQISRYKEKDSYGAFEWVNFRKHGGYKEDAPTMYFPIFIKKDGSSFRVPKLIWDELRREYIVEDELCADEFISYPIDENGRERRWKWSLERTLQEKKELSIRKDRNGEYAVYIKSRMKDEGMLPLSVWDDKHHSSTEYGTNLLKDILGEKIFDYPKSLYAVIDSLKVANAGKNSIILDFFAGSGTTLHATMQLNAEDGGKRQCILVTNNENNICEEVTYERNKRVIYGYTTPKGVEVEGLKNNSLRYYKTDFISRDRTMKNMRQLVQVATDMLCIKDDLYIEQTMFGKWKINPKVARYFSDGKKQMMVVYDERAVAQLPGMIAETDLEGEKLKIYIFSPERYAFDDDFYEVKDKVQLVALPAAIYDAYQKVLPKRKPKMLDIAEEKGGEA